MRLKARVLSADDLSISRSRFGGRLKLSRVSAGRAPAACLFLLVLVLSMACATGPAMPFDQLVAPTEIVVPDEAAETSESTEAAAATATPPPEPTATPVPAIDLRPTAEVKYLRFMKAPVAEVVREQSWYATLSPATMELVAAIQRCEKASQSRGEAASVADMLRYASEQGWYSDGLDEREVKGLSAVFDAYGTSLGDEDLISAGSVLASTLRWALFEPMKLPESGEIVVLSSSPDEARGRLLLQTAVKYMQPVEELVGKFPYRFLHFTVSDEMPDELLGLSINQFIIIHGDFVEPYVVAHEITHSTLYGNFPAWFEEGMAHFAQYNLTSSLAEGVAELKGELASAKLDVRVDLRPGAATWVDDAVERYRGFLFLNGVHEIQGHDAFKSMVRQFRTRNFEDQDLLRALVAYPAPSETQASLRKLICASFIGVRNMSC